MAEPIEKLAARSLSQERLYCWMLGVTGSFQPKTMLLPDWAMVRFCGGLHSSEVCPLKDTVAERFPEVKVTSPVSYSLSGVAGVYFT